MLTGYPVQDWCSVCWTTQLEACKPVKQLRSNGNVFYAPCRLIEHYIYIDFPFSLRRFNILYISDCSLEQKLPRTVTTEEANIVNLASCTQNYSNIYYLGELTAPTLPEVGTRDLGGKTFPAHRPSLTNPLSKNYPIFQNKATL